MTSASSGKSLPGQSHLQPRSKGRREHQRPCKMNGTNVLMSSRSIRNSTVTASFQTTKRSTPISLHGHWSRGRVKTSSLVIASVSSMKWVSSFYHYWHFVEPIRHILSSLMTDAPFISYLIPDFEWNNAAMDIASDEDWNQKFFELSQFKVINGHTNVAAWPSDPRACSLAEWCTQQRYYYENLWASRYSPLTEDRTKQLNQVRAMHACRASFLFPLVFAPGEHLLTCTVSLMRIVQCNAARL